MTLQEEINVLVIQKQNLIRKLDTKEINQETYDEDIKRIEEQLGQRNNERIIEIKQEKKQKEISTQNNLQEEIKTMVDEKVSEEAPKKIGKGIQKNSYASVICAVLQRKGTKNIDVAAERVLEIKPGNEPNKVKGLIRTIIRETQQCKGRWKAYTWDKENYLLVPKVE